MSKWAFAGAVFAGFLTAGAAQAQGYGYGYGCNAPCGAPADAVIFRPIYTAPTYYFQPTVCDNCYAMPLRPSYRKAYRQNGRAMRRVAYRPY